MSTVNVKLYKITYNARVVLLIYCFSKDNFAKVMSVNEADDQMEASSSESEDEVMEGDEENDDRPKTYLPGQPLKDDERLVCDQSAYIMLHQAQTGAPCLSFDIVPDNLGNDRNEYPMTAYLVAGTQASSAHLNK